LEPSQMDMGMQPCGWRWKPGLGYAHLKQIAVTLYAYQCDHGFLPNHPSGPDHALYLVKPYLSGEPHNSVPDDVTLFDCPDSKHRINGPSRWDDPEKRLVDGDYDYLNPKPVATDESETYRDRVILAEKSGLRDTGRWFVTSHFDIVWHSFSGRSGDSDLLGNEWSLCDGVHQE
jgi:hypothetical protein